MEISTQKYIEGPSSLFFSFLFSFFFNFFLGPSLVVDHVLSLTNAKDIESLTKQENFLWDLTQKSDLYLKSDEDKKLEQRTLLTSGR